MTHLCVVRSWAQLASNFHVNHASQKWWMWMGESLETPTIGGKNRRVSNVDFPTQRMRIRISTRHEAAPVTVIFHRSVRKSIPQTRLRKEAVVFASLKEAASYMLSQSCDGCVDTLIVHSRYSSLC